MRGRRPVAFFLALITLVSGGTLSAVAVAATEIGQSEPRPGFEGTCFQNGSFVQKGVASGTAYVVPAGGGVITRWRTTAFGGQLALRLYSGDPSGTTFTAVAESQPESPASAGVKEFQSRVPASGGELLGLRTGPAVLSECLWITPSHPMGQAFTVPPIGVPATYGTVTNLRIGISATVEPDLDKDGFGDETQDLCPSRPGRQDDCTDPVAAIDKGPKKKTDSAKATFRFSSSEEGGTFECALDGRRYKPCSSPKKLKGLDPGRHRFELRAIDANENIGEADSHRWRVTG